MPHDDTQDRYLPIEEVLDRVACSRATLYRMIKDKALAFPPPVKLFSSSRWREARVLNWLQAQEKLQDEARNPRRAGGR